MEEHDLSLDLGMLCRCCDCRSYDMPNLEGFTPSQVKLIEELCKLCVENFKQSAVND